jgi:hypothetical protein
MVRKGASKVFKLVQRFHKSFSLLLTIKWNKLATSTGKKNHPKLYTSESFSTGAKYLKVCLTFVEN